MSIRSDTRESPYKMFTGQEPPWRLDHFCVFGSPAFVLAKKQQDGDTLPKWKARSCSGVYVGHSLVHSGKVPIIYNQRTKHISPQYHVIFDDQFMAVTTNPADMSLTFFDSLYSLWVGAVGAAFMMVVLWLIIRDASRSPPRDHPR